MAGGGVGLGYSIFWDDMKFGLNAIAGVEWSFNKIPLSVQVDFRPGYGLLCFSEVSFFDWALAASIRYNF